MAINGLDRLQKELDTLTYNSRSVLNALIRSVMTTGSSAGFSAERVGETITLSRVDIYRIYNFYQAWQTAGYTVTAFNAILAEQDTVVVRQPDGTQITQATYSALVKHAKMLFLTASTATKSDADWITYLATYSSPKLLTNTAPIPINLRTPIFDENLSTTEFNVQPTYLFPQGYFQLSSLGYSGDDVDHEMGGRSWTISVSDWIDIITPRFSSGSVNTDATRKTRSVRNGTIDNAYTTVFGYDTAARSMYSTAGGHSSVVPAPKSTTATGCDSAIAFGNRQLAGEFASVSLGGDLNIAAGSKAHVVGGSGNAAAGESSGA